MPEGERSRGALVRRSPSSEDLARKISELEAKLEEILSKVGALARRLDMLGKRVSACEKRASLIREVESSSRREERFRGYNTYYVDDLISAVASIEERLRLLEESALMRVEREPCKHVDSEGYCTVWLYRRPVEEWSMKAESMGDRILWRVNVRLHPLICTACPFYNPRRD